MNEDLAYRFWMVYVEGKRGPAYKHATRPAAEQEARRLALETRLPAYILESTTVFYVPEPSVTRLEQQYKPEIPSYPDEPQTQET